MGSRKNTKPDNGKPLTWFQKYKLKRAIKKNRQLTPGRLEGKDRERCIEFIMELTHIMEIKLPVKKNKQTKLQDVTTELLKKQTGKTLLDILDEALKELEKLT